MFRPATLMLVALAALVGAAFGVRQYTPQYLPDQFTTDAVLRERLREIIAEDEVGDAFFDRFEVLFPADYEAIMSGIVALYRRGGSGEQARVYGESYMRRFLEDNKRYIAQAEPAVLTSLATVLAEGTRAMRESDSTACAQTLRGGGFNAGDARGASAASKAALTNMAVVTLEAIASGRRHAVQYAPPTQRQATAWLERYASLGGDEAVLEAMNDPVRLDALPPETLCHAGELMWTAALQAEDDFAPRFVSLAVSQ